jgi:hypothetical protein
MDNVGLEVGLLGTSSSIVIFTFYFFLMIVQVVLGGDQWPITCFKGVRDNFMVHDVNNSLVSYETTCH